MNFAKWNWNVEKAPFDSYKLDFTPLGGNREIKVDVRIICALLTVTLSVEVEEGRFREDPFTIVYMWCPLMPPLRERGSDIVTLANHSWNFTPNKTRRNTNLSIKRHKVYLSAIHGRGNVRQLQNIIRNIVR